MTHHPIITSHRRSLFGAACILGLLLCQGGNRTALRAADSGQGAIEGTWDLTVVGSPFRIVRTFKAGGTNIDSSNFTPITFTPGPLTVSDGHGNWIKTGPNRYAMTLEFIQFDPVLGRLDSIGKVREVIQLGPDPNSYVGDFSTDIFLPDGTKIISLTGGRVEGKRMSAKP